MIGIVSAVQLAPNGPNQLWMADIIYVAIATGFIYVAATRLRRKRPMEAVNFRGG